MMGVDLRWHIGKEGASGTRLDAPPFRAFFYWVQDDQLVKSTDFSLDELEIEIDRRRNAGENTEPFLSALKRLR